MICYQPVSLSTFCSSFGKHYWDCLLIERQYIWLSIFRNASFCPLDLIAACISKMKQTSVWSVHYIHTHTHGHCHCLAVQLAPVSWTKSVYVCGLLPTLINLILSFVGYTIHHCKKDSHQKTFPRCVRWNHCVPLARHIAYQPSCWTGDVIDMCVAKCMCTAVTWYTVLNIIHYLGCKLNMDNQHSMDISYIMWILL